MKKCWRDLGEIEKLLEQRRQRETKPYIKLLLAKVGSIMRQLLNGRRFVVYQKYEDDIRDAKVILEFLFSQKVDWAFQPRTFNNYTLLALFLTSTTCAGGSNAPLANITEKL